MFAGYIELNDLANGWGISWLNRFIFNRLSIWLVELFKQYLYSILLLRLKKCLFMDLSRCCGVVFFMSQVPVQCLEWERKTIQTLIVGFIQVQIAVFSTTGKSSVKRYSRNAMGCTCNQINSECIHEMNESKED